MINQGVLSPILVLMLWTIGNNRRIMGKNKLGLIIDVGLVATALVIFGASGLLFYGLATGQGGGRPDRLVAAILFLAQLFNQRRNG